jgi:predicted O-linked N-acetylglucosamine transferase (SPINDLY family)
LETNPNFAPARWYQALLLPVLYNHPDEIASSRRRFTQQLDTLIRETGLETEEQRAFAYAGMAATTNFYLQYQGYNDLDLQKQYGEFAAAIMQATFSQWAAAKPMPKLQDGTKMRIGYVSSLIYGHTIGIFLLGWLKDHNRDQFEIFLLSRRY